MQGRSRACMHAAMEERRWSQPHACTRAGRLHRAPSSSSLQRPDGRGLLRGSERERAGVVISLSDGSAISDRVRLGRSHSRLLAEDDMMMMPATAPCAIASRRAAAPLRAVPSFRSARSQPRPARFLAASASSAGPADSGQPSSMVREDDRGTVVCVSFDQSQGALEALQWAIDHLLKASFSCTQLHACCWPGAV